MQLTERDVEILKFINDFGFCEISQIEKRFQIRRHRCYKVMNRLLKAELVIRKRMLYNQGGIFQVSKKGAKYTDLPYMTTIPLNAYNHHIKIIEVYCKLMQQYPNATWLSERMLKRINYIKKVDKKIHNPDGVLILPDESEIAIEVELTTKGERRLRQIMRSYITQFHIKEVWYFCTNQPFNKITKLAADLDYIKVYSLRQFLDESD